MQVTLCIVQILKLYRISHIYVTETPLFARYLCLTKRIKSMGSLIQCVKYLKCLCNEISPQRFMASV